MRGETPIPGSRPAGHTCILHSRGASSQDPCLGHRVRLSFWVGCGLEESWVGGRVIQVSPQCCSSISVLFWGRDFTSFRLSSSSLKWDLLQEVVPPRRAGGCPVLSLASGWHLMDTHCPHSHLSRGVSASVQALRN